jgi:hypothetical protein
LREGGDIRFNSVEKLTEDALGDGARMVVLRHGGRIRR